uniref:Bromo adjacent y domain-containing 1 protein n=1 Tax=Aceria tosichella TaxID=561515 RepID=A0A6G1SIU4_9ACAR
MSRPAKSERSGANSKGRPKRRAATNYLYKYQLAGDPNRIEENALKKALQESLEEQKITSPKTMITPNKTNTNKTGQSKDSISQKTRAIINSSTNSSDVSKGSNNSSSTTNTSSDSRDLSTYNGGAVNKRLRSNASLPSVTPTISKRAKLTTNGHCNSSNHKRCDNSDTCVLAASPVPSFNGAITRTYSRSQHQELQRQNCDVNPRSSTPIAATKKLVATNDNRAGSKEPAVSASTQTSNNIRPEVSLTRNTTTNDRTKSKDDPKSSKVQTQKNDMGNIDKSGDATKFEQSPPVQHQYLKLKRESKNYAYAKMTALKVNTGKSYYLGFSKSSSSSSKKGSPVGILNNNNTNKYTGKTSLKGFNKTDTSRSVGGSEHRSNNNSLDSPSPNSMPKNSRQQEKSSRSFQGLHPAVKMSIPKNNLSATSQGLHKNDRSFNHTLDLSRNQNQASVNVAKKRVVQGSWSLLGVPEEKILYIRDDEPPKRLICYPAIKHLEGDVIQVRDSVLLRSGAKQTDLPYIAKVCAFWEDAETGGVMMSLFWYYRPEHTEEGRKPHHLIDEIFASRHRDADSVECIEDKCYVLTFNEYCRYRKRCKMEQVNTSWSLTDVTIPVSNESYPRRNRIPDSSVNPELVFCCRQIYDSRSRRLIKNPLINTKYGNI